MTNEPKSSSPSRRDALVVLVALVFPTLITWVYFVLLADHSPGVQQAAYGVSKVLQFGFPLFWVVVICRERVRLSWPNRAGLAEGAVFGAVVFTAILLLYHFWLEPGGYLDKAAEEVRGKVAGFGLDSVAKYAALGIFYSLFHSLLEEYYWRWFVFGQLRRLIPLWAAVVVSSLGFMAHHVLVLGAYFGGFSLATVFFSLCVAVGGLFWAWLYHRSRSLYGPWLSHMLVDAAIFTLGYFLSQAIFLPNGG